MILTRLKQYKALTATAPLVVALGLSLALIAAPASAAKKGPRASLSAATVCKIDGDDLNVEVRLTDNTSGTGEAAVLEVAADGLTKTAKGPWEKQGPPFDSATKTYAGEAQQPTNKTVTLDLCTVSSWDGVKAINAAATVKYMLKGSNPLDPLTDIRIIDNRCGDDPSTEDIVEPAGIILTSEIIQGIETACSP